MTLRDDLGRSVTLGKPARRIVSLTPATTENLFAFGAGNLVVGVTSVDTFPPEVKKLPRVGDFGRPSYEQLFALKPDLIVLDSATIPLAEAEALARKVRCPIFVQKSQKVSDIARHLRQLGALTDKTPDAERAARMLETQIAVVPKQTGHRPSVFVEVSAVPLYAAGPGSFVDDVIVLAGGINALKAGGPFPQVSKEALLSAKPEVYVVALGPGEKPRRGTVGILADHLFRPTPRLALGLEALAAALRAKK
jgi:iron complex transport system substrate-binding protein